MNGQKNTKSSLERPEISIIVPVYKTEKYLSECIESILAQTFTDFELILVDDGSPDGCPALCDTAAEKDSRVRVIHKPNGGVSTARNAGLAAVRGNWVGFVDSDDVIDKTYYEKLYNAAIDAGAEVAVGGILGIEQDGTPCKHQEYLLKNEVLSQKEAIRRIRLTPIIQATTRLHRRDILEEIEFPVGRNYEDAATTPSILERTTCVACVNEPLYHYRMNPNGIMRGRATLANLYEVEANYALFNCLRNHGVIDGLFLQYAIMHKALKKTKKKLSREELKSVRVQEASSCVKRAWREMRNTGAVNPKTILEVLFYFINPQLYRDFKFGRK